VKTGAEIMMMVKRYRWTRNISRMRFAEIADIPDGTLSKLESGDNVYPALATAVKLADAMGITLDELVRKNERKKKECTSTKTP
jgi:DNA-binding XRE family transcriptional regulator